MRIVLQKVLEASVEVDEKVLGQIGKGYVLLLCVMQGDTDAQAQWLAEKVLKLRLFEGEGGKINDRTVLEVDGSILVVSQFTLAGDVSGSNRPEYTKAAPKEEAMRLCDRFVALLQAAGVNTEVGQFGAHMHLHLLNDGPVTLTLER